MLLGHPIKRETRTTGRGGGWHNTPPSNPRRERQVGWWLEQNTPIEPETRTTGGGGGCQRRPPSIARCERRVEVVVGTTHPHRTRDANDGRRWWLAQHTPIERETRTMGKADGWHTKVHPHRTRDVNYGWSWWVPMPTPIDQETQTTGVGLISREMCHHLRHQWRWLPLITPPSSACPFPRVVSISSYKRSGPRILVVRLAGCRFRS